MSSVCFTGGFVLSYSENAFLKRNMLCKDGVIEKITNEDVIPKADKYIDVKGKYIVPGFVEAHTHGRVGFDFNTADAGGILRMLKSYYQRGVTTVFPTLASAPFESLLEKGKFISEYKTEETGIARIGGVHIEGRYLNPEKKGAHAPELLTTPSESDVPKILETISGRLHVSAAFELDYDESFIKALTGGGATVGLAHTSADYATTEKLYKKYGISLTHMYNAMNPLHHRAGGPIAFAFTSDMYTEIIADGIHISPEMVKLAYRCKGFERLVLITDSMEATDSPDGEYSIAGQPVIVKDSIARTLEGALAGSTLSMPTAINNLVKFAGATYEEAIRCATLNPASMLGIDKYVGSLSVGKFADLNICSFDEKGMSLSYVYSSVGCEKNLNFGKEIK